MFYICRKTALLSYQCQLSELSQCECGFPLDVLNFLDKKNQGDSFCNLFFFKLLNAKQCWFIILYAKNPLDECYYRTVIQNASKIWILSITVLRMFVLASFRKCYRQVLKLENIFLWTTSNWLISLLFKNCHVYCYIFLT